MQNLDKHDISYKIKLTTSIDPKEFVWVTSECKSEVDCIEANRNINGKSLLGVLSMNLSEPITVVFHDVYGNEPFLEKIKRWEVED